jgi:hypothetical protein
VAELGRDQGLVFDADAVEEIGAEERGVVGRAAGGEDDFLRAADEPDELAKGRLLFVLQGKEHPVHGRGLLQDLLHHMMLEHLPGRRFPLPDKSPERLIHGPAALVVKLESVVADDGEFVVVEKSRLGRQVGKGVDVRGHDVHVLGDAENKRRIALDGINLAASPDLDKDGERPGESLQEIDDHGFHRFRLQPFLKVMADDFGVRFAREPVAFPKERFLELLEVLDDPVVDDDDGFVAGGVGMGVRLRDAAVGGPARVGDAGPRQAGSGDGDRSHGFPELAAVEITVRIITPVFEPFQPAQEHGDGEFLTGRDADNAAHGTSAGFPLSEGEPSLYDKSAPMVKKWHARGGLFSI